MPLSEELEEIQWPHRLNPAVLPQFDGESDPEEFLLKYEATIEAARGGTACKVKALVLALRGLAQRWYANIPPGSISSWVQLRSQLRSSFRAVKPDEVTSCDFHNLKQGSMTLQEYLQSLIKLRARGPDVTDQSIIDSVVNGISLGPCGEYLTRRRPKTVTKLFEIMQEYCISVRAKRQKLEEMNEKRKSRNSERSHQKPWHSDQSKQKTVNSISEEESSETSHHKNKGGRDHHEDRSSREDKYSREDRSSREDRPSHDNRSNREDRYNREDHYQKGRREKGGRREKTPFCYFHGKDQGHWTNECQSQLKRRQSSNAKIHN